MEQQQSSVEKFEKFIWKVENFSRLKKDEVYSEPFALCGYPWQLCLLPKGGDGDDCLALYLVAVKTSNMSEGWSRHVNFQLLVFNQLNTNQTITEDFGDCEFNASKPCRGFVDVMKLVEFNDMGFFVEDACIVGAEVYVCKSKNEKPLNQAANFNPSLTFGSHKLYGFQVPNLKTFSPVSTLVCTEPAKYNDAEMFSPSNEVLMDFSSFGQIEEMYSDNPSLVERPSKRSHNFADLAFAALGRVLYFLKTRKVKDMNEQACKDLQVLWDELVKFRFDLTWLESHVQYALGIKSYVEKVLQLEKSKENMVAIELETERLKAKLDVAELNVDIEQDLLKAKGFEERDLESELGCGSWRP